MRKLFITLATAVLVASALGYLSSSAAADLPDVEEPPCVQTSEQPGWPECWDYSDDPPTGNPKLWREWPHRNQDIWHMRDWTESVDGTLYQVFDYLQWEEYDVWPYIGTDVEQLRKQGHFDECIELDPADPARWGCTGPTVGWGPAGRAGVGDFTFDVWLREGPLAKSNNVDRFKVAKGYSSCDEFGVQYGSGWPHGEVHTFYCLR